jgi:hypothetical protein
MSKPDKAPDVVQDLARRLKEKNHSPRLDEASIAVCFEDSKPFKKDRFNWGTVKKFPPLGKAFPGERHDFVLIVPYAGWEMFTENQKMAWLDLLLETCQVEYVPETVVENKKKKPVIDEFGRKKYTSEIMRDKEGLPKWKKVPLDLPTYVSNVKRFGCWCPEIVEIKEVVQ